MGINWYPQIELPLEERKKWVREHLIHKIAMGASFDELLKNAPKRKLPCESINVAKDRNGLYYCNRCPLYNELIEKNPKRYSLGVPLAPCGFRAGSIRSNMALRFDLRNNACRSMFPSEMLEYADELEKEINPDVLTVSPITEAIHWLRICAKYGACKTLFL